MEFIGTPVGGTLAGLIVLIIAAGIRMWLKTHTNCIRINEHEKLCNVRGEELKENVRDIKEAVTKVDAKVDRMVDHLLGAGSSGD
jgi:hypothetical protein